MRSSRRLAQSGQSITEAVVATAILGITVVVALGTIDASIGGGRMAVRQAWAQCIARETSGAIKQASWAQSYAAPANVLVTVGPAPSPTTGLQTVIVTASDPDTRQPLYSVTFLKAAALAGTQSIGAAVPSLAAACPRP
jgi:Tfp pilus assembly protein PilV